MGLPTLVARRQRLPGVDERLELFFFPVAQTHPPLAFVFFWPPIGRRFSWPGSSLRARNSITARRTTQDTAASLLRANSSRAACCSFVKATETLCGSWRPLGRGMLSIDSRRILPHKTTKNNLK